MRSWLLCGMLFLSTAASGQTSALSNLWSELKAKRDALPGLHQEFEVSRVYKTAHGDRTSHSQITVDISLNKWRERSVSGSEDRIRIYDGQDLFFFESGGEEYVRTKHRAKEDDPTPGPYGSIELDWSKAKEAGRQPCGFSGADHQCIIVDAPVKKQARSGIYGEITRISQGVSRLALDSQTGMVIQSKAQEVIENEHSSYVLEVSYSLKRMTYGAALDPALFKLPESGVREVKELPRWDVARFKKLLVGKPAPELSVTDMQGNPVSLSTLKGKTVLIDFWTTWCPPCRADAPALDKLFSKYGGKDLMIIGVSVNEDREVVETFLKEHPHNFPVVLTSENEMPRQYQIGTFPTYMVIDSVGTLTSAAEGDQGFGDLRKSLKKAGLDTD